jgi:hypothetical protein
MGISIDTQFSIFLINKPGVLGSVTEALAKNEVNMYALSLSDSGEHGVLRVVGDDPEKTRAVLQETHDRWTETDVLVVPISNAPGAFASTANRLAEGGVNVLYAYCTSPSDVDHARAIFKVSDNDKAKEILADL